LRAAAIILRAAAIILRAGAAIILQAGYFAQFRADRKSANTTIFGLLRLAVMSSLWACWNRRNLRLSSS
jgi:hypothetical protein